MADETTTPSVLNVITRETYENRKSAGTLDDVVYFVLEPTSGAGDILSLYVGLRHQTDLINLNKSEEYYANGTYAYDFSTQFTDIPINKIAVEDKLYLWEDHNLGVAKIFIHSAIDGTTMPLYGNPVWETL